MIKYSINTQDNIEYININLVFLKIQLLKKWLISGNITTQTVCNIA